MFVTNGLGSPVAMTVNCEPGAAPNPSCCSDPNTMCVNCAKQTLDGLTANVPSVPTPAPLGNVEPLPESAWPGPVANYNSYLGSEPVQSGAGAEPLPATNWAEVFKPQPRSTDEHRPDPPRPLTTTVAGGVEPLPEMDFGF